VVPVHIDGTYRIWPRGGDRLRRSPTRITFGSPIVAAQGEDARKLEARIATVLAVLADESRSDWWSARRRAGAGQTPSPGGPTASPWRRAWALGPDPHEREDDDETRWALTER
jgi:hypothetical protein